MQSPQQQVVYVLQRAEPHLMNVKSSGLTMLLAMMCPGVDFFYLEDTKTGFIRILLYWLLIWTIIVPIVVWLKGVTTSSKRTTEYNNLLVARDQDMTRNQSMIQR
jgi:TM2 domain-containing membrane protein YozV